MMESGGSNCDSCSPIRSSISSMRHTWARCVYKAEQQSVWGCFFVFKLFHSRQPSIAPLRLLLLISHPSLCFVAFPSVSCLCCSLRAKHRKTSEESAFIGQQGASAHEQIKIHYSWAASGDSISQNTWINPDESAVTPLTNANEC